MNFNWFGFLAPNSVGDELPEIFPLSIAQKDFVENDVIHIYSKILTDVAERSDGLSDEDQALLWDNCLASESRHGLITLLARAMVWKNELFLVLDKSTKVLRRANAAEQAQITADYAKQASSNVGVYVCFKHYCRTDMIRIYSALEFFSVGSMNKSMNVANAVQIKIEGLRASVSLVDSDVAKKQAMSIANALVKGRGALLDAKDEIETATPDTTAAEKSMMLFNQKRAFYLGMPSSYITGELNAGLGDSGKADTKAIDRGLKVYFFSVFKPVASALFGKNLTYKSDDFEFLESALETIKTFDITSAQFMTDENKLKIVNKLFGLPPDTAGGPAPEDVNPLETSKPTEDPNKAVPPVAGAKPAAGY